MKGWLGDHEYHVGVSGLYATRTAIDLFAEADVVIGVGASLNHYDRARLHLPQCEVRSRSTSRPRS